MSIEANTAVLPESPLDQEDAAIDTVDSEEEAEKRNAESLKAVEKILGITGTDEKKPSGVDDPNSHAEGTEVVKPDEFNQATKDRANAAGIPEELALRLHQSGLLDESLAAFDRRAIESASKDSKPKATEPPEAKAKAETKPTDRNGEEGVLPPLDPDQFDEVLVKRDAFYQKQIAELKNQVAALSQSTESVAKQRDDQFQRWFVKEVSGLKNTNLFGNGDAVEDGTQRTNRQTLCDGYERICIAHGVDPYDCNPEMLHRAYPAMFPKEVFKAAQRDTVERLRNAEGKFVNSTRSSGSVPSSSKRKTQEEVDAEMLRKVEGIMKKSYK